MTDQKAITNYDRIKTLAKNKSVIESFAGVVGSKQGAIAYINSALLAVASNDKLMQCTPASVMSSALRAATMQLSCDPSLGQAYIVPFKGVATFQVGYRGLEQLALRTNKYRFINTSYISEGQSIEEDALTGVTRIYGARKEGGKIIGYFNYFELFSGYSHTLYMTVEEIDDHAKKYSPSYGFDSSLWKKDFHKMALKTVLKLNLQKNGVIEMRTLLEADQDPENETELPITFDTTFEEIDTTPEPPAPSRPTQEVMSELGFTPEPTAAKNDKLIAWLVTEHHAIDASDAKKIISEYKKPLTTDPEKRDFMTWATLRPHSEVKS